MINLTTYKLAFCFGEFPFKFLIVPGMAVRGMRGMMGDIALSLSSSLGSRR